MLNRILNIVGWIGTALVAVALATIMVPKLNNYGEYARPLAIAGLICVVAYTAGQWREIAALFARRQARYGTLTATSVAIVLGILVLLNYIGSRQHKRWDLTATKQYSLSDQTKTVLSKLDAPLQIMVFAADSDFERYRDRLKEYEYVSKRITTEYIDPAKKPAVARQNQVTSDGTIVVNYKGRSERVSSDTEQDITTGIIKAVSGQVKKVYFTQGHGERDTGSSAREGYSTIASALTRENYTVEKLTIAQQSSVPDDASVVVIAGPRTDFFAPEIDALKKYLDNAGKLVLELDPPTKADNAPMANLEGLAHDWGMEIGNNVVVDISGMGRLIGTQDASVPVVAPPYTQHAITANFAYLTAFPLARSVSPVSGGVGGHVAQPFIETSPRSWAETDLQGVLTTGQVGFDEGKDKKGPVAIASAVSAPSTAVKKDAPADAPKPETRVAVIGDSDFAANYVLGIEGNRDLFMNIVGWVSQQENLISIRPKEAGDSRITLTATQQSNIKWFTLLVLPLAMFGTGVYSWWRRR